VKSFKTGIHKPLAFVIEGVSWLTRLKGLKEAFIIPFLSQLLARISQSFSQWISDDMQRRFLAILNNRYWNSILGYGKVFGSPVCENAMAHIVYRRPLSFGGRFLQLLAFIDKLDVIEPLFSQSPIAGERIEMVAHFIVVSKNPLLLETLMFLDKVMFGTDFSKLFDSPFQRRWCVLTQALWFLVADDAVLSQQCRDVEFL
jgi:hypothetical protein